MPNKVSELSVILPVYNTAAYLPEAIASIDAQTFGNFEVIAIDDGSTDETPAILAEWARRDARVRVVRHAINRKIARALNTGLEAARGRMVVRADGDDVNLPERFARLRHAAAANPRHAVIGSAISVAGGVRRFPATTVGIRARLLWGCPFSHPSVLLNRDVLGDFRYDPAFPVAEDVELWWRTVFRHPAMNLPEPLLVYRVRADSASNSLGAARLEWESALDLRCESVLGFKFAPNVGAACRLGNRVAGVAPRVVVNHMIKSAGRAKELGLVPSAALRRELLWQGCAFVRRYGRRRLVREWPEVANALLGMIPAALKL